MLPIRRLRSAIPPALEPAARSLHHALFRLNLRVRCAIADLTEKDDARGPVPPALVRYRVCESLSREEFFRIGRGCADLIRDQLGNAGVNLMHARSFLDFGCGCARTLRWLINHYPKVNFYGADVDAESIAWCSEHYPSAKFVASNPEPPLPYPDGLFDVICCVSVFTHLDESMQDLWFAELARLLTPDGVLLFSVHGEASAAVLDADDMATFRSAGFVHRRSKKMNGITPEWYQTSWHSREYITSRMARWFAETRYATIADGAQDFVVAARPLAAGAPSVARASRLP